MLDVAASASAGKGFSRGGGDAPASAGRSGNVDGVKAGALRGMSGGLVPTTRDGGTEPLAVTGGVGTVSDFGPGVPFAAA